ncbi:hypothetical protein [Psychroserpens damuponensis]|uniref:hypothetical protein n=1 Tax=Psychroserpens damuponensis TaxID=943936 RepID=UPI0005910E51|nr:hypothetical protein [Psychroserpens damuponensis]
MNNKQTFCTIITSNYFFYAKAIYDSLAEIIVDFNFNVLVVDEDIDLIEYKTIKIIRLNEIKTVLKSDYSMIQKYESDLESNLRWALKPVFLKYLLTIRGYDKVFFLDPDLYFYSDPSFLLDILDHRDVILTPHWRSKDPFLDASNFNCLFTEGLYNAGFFGCNKNAINVLDWWLSVCSYKMEKEEGFYVDQIYLNLMPIYFSSQVQVIEHRGCNISNWNRVECERTNIDNEVLINNSFPIVFIHYTNATIKLIANGIDGLLEPQLNMYKQTLEKHNPEFQFAHENAIIKKDKTIISKIFYKLFK